MYSAFEIYTYLVNRKPSRFY